MKEKLTGFFNFCIRFKKQRKLSILKKELTSMRSNTQKMQMLSDMSGFEMSDQNKELLKKAEGMVPTVEARIKELESELESNLKNKQQKG